MGRSAPVPLTLEYIRAAARLLKHSLSSPTLPAEMKLIVFAALVGVCLGAKLPGHVDGGHDGHHSEHHEHHDAGFVHHGDIHHDRPPVAILFDDRQAPADGSYATNFETEDGVRVTENGQPGSAGQGNVEGSYSFTDPDGNLVEVRYVADEFGFRAESPYVPTPHPLPAHALQQIAYAEELRKLREQNGEIQFS
ncbi:LOW QUALITY PROTEIN: cuticle protein AM1199-like [Scylla paramamosain]|uniref:LOW QUALITY PROTEIN: cuticle protein AM1199-like n=1 Tax=Scylla paramamosain TaxID=85552 RepID=UPI0030835A08